jgi:GNAT superfamily N-acetyltransferase
VTVSGEGRRRFSIRVATRADLAALEEVLRESVLGLGSADYTPEQNASALAHMYGMDTRLIDDGTYFAVEDSNGAILACGGWSRRRTLFGGDRFAERSDDRLDPAMDAARIRAFFVRPGAARQGLGRLLMDECEKAARLEGFRKMELMATLTGIPLYEHGGFRPEERTEIVLPDGVRFPLVRMTKDLSIREEERR